MRPRSCGRHTRLIYLQKFQPCSRSASRFARGRMLAQSMPAARAQPADLPEGACSHSLCLPPALSQPVCQRAHALPCCAHQGPCLNMGFHPIPPCSKNCRIGKKQMVSILCAVYFEGLRQVQRLLFGANLPGCAKPDQLLVQKGFALLLLAQK